MITYKLGTFVTVKNISKKIYIVVKRGVKGGNQIYTCIPIISKSKRTETDRYVFSIFKDSFIVLNKEERFASFQIEYKQARMAKDIVSKIIEKYKSYNPDRYDKDRQDPETADGCRAGNPWQGMAMMKQRPKVYKG